MQDIDREDALFHEHMEALRVRLGGALGGAAVVIVFAALVWGALA